MHCMGSLESRPTKSGQDVQNAQGEQVAHLWTYMFLFKEEPYIEAFKHFLLGTGNFFQLRRGAPIVRLAQSAGLLSFSTPIDAIYLACMYAFCMDLIERNELRNVGPPVLTNVLLGISLLDYTAHPPILAGPDEAAPSRQQLNQYKFTMEWLVECISHVAQPNCTLQLHCFEMICHAIHTYKLCAINCPKNVGPVAFLEALWPVSSGCMDHIIWLIPAWVEEAPVSKHPQWMGSSGSLLGD